MLKIKDNVDLKELEKFNFTVVDDDFIWIEGTEDIAIDRNKRTILVYGDYEEGNYSLDKLYDLIQAGLVIKEW